MKRANVAISLEEGTVRRSDQLVSQLMFSKRSQAIPSALDEKLERMKPSRLARERATLDPVMEKRLAAEGMSGELPEWPECREVAFVHAPALTRRIG